MGVERLAEGKISSSPCPRAITGGAAPATVESCPALEFLAAEPGSEAHLAEAVGSMLDCRAFLWDVLLDGEWTGCAAGLLRELAELYGWEKVLGAFEEE